MLNYQSVGFQLVRQAPLFPYVESARNLFFGKQKPYQLFCQQLSRFDQQEFEKTDSYSSQFNQEKLNQINAANNFDEVLKLLNVMTHEKAKTCISNN
jgi:hypothetical protein